MEAHAGKPLRVLNEEELEGFVSIVFSCLAILRIAVPSISNYSWNPLGVQDVAGGEAAGVAEGAARGPWGRRRSYMCIHLSLSIYIYTYIQSTIYIYNI